jgi:signal transduction histidine kinase
MRYEKPEDADKRAKHFATIKGAIHNLTNILNDFLSLDKLDTGKIECHPETFSLDDFIGEITEIVRTMTKKEQRVVYERQGSDGVIRTDKNMLRNILINLLSNAAKYSPEGQEIHLNVKIGDSSVVITVQDFGFGIPSEDQKHLFERFFRAKNAVTIQGTGLGLNIVKRYLDLMGGDIRFTSEQNVGTTFTITLPNGKAL